MKKADKISLVFILILIFYFSSIFILNRFVKDQELTDLFTNFTAMIILAGVFIFFGYLTIKTKKYSRNQKIFLLLHLIIIGFIDIILLIIATVSSLMIHYFILGIYNSISLATFAISLVIIESKTVKKDFY